MENVYELTKASNYVMKLLFVYPYHCEACIRAKTKTTVLE